MSFRRFAVRLILAAVLIQLGSLPALAADAAAAPPAQETEGAAVPEDSGETPGAGADVLPGGADPWPLLDPEELSALVKEYLDAHKLDETKCAVSFCYTGTGESWNYNGDTYMTGASLYKLPLMMNLAKKVWAGELSQDGKVYGYDISYIEMRSLTYSDNEISEMIIEYFYPFRSYRMMLAETAGYTEEDLPTAYFQGNIFSANFMLGVLKELYYNTEQYPNVVECMLNANPGEYLRLSLDGKYTVAQKYGAVPGYTHIAGIVYTPVPCLVCVMTQNTPSAQNVIAGLGEILADYAVTLDQRSQGRREQLRNVNREVSLSLAEGQVKTMEAEKQRVAAEENERRAAEEARIAAQEEAERERLEAERLAAVQARERAAAPLKRFVILTAALLAVLVTAYLIRALLKRKKQAAPLPEENTR